MSTEGIIWIIVDMIVVTTAYSWAICHQVSKEEKARSNEDEPNKQ